MPRPTGVLAIISAITVHNATPVTAAPLTAAPPVAICNQQSSCFTSSVFRDPSHRNCWAGQDAGRPWGWVPMAYGAFPAAAALSAAPAMATTNRHSTRFAAVPTPTSACACTLLGAS